MHSNSICGLGFWCIFWFDDEELRAGVKCGRNTCGGYSNNTTILLCNYLQLNICCAALFACSRAYKGAVRIMQPARRTRPRFTVPMDRGVGRDEQKRNMGELWRTKGVSELELRMLELDAPPPSTTCYASCPGISRIDRRAVFSLDRLLPVRKTSLLDPLCPSTCSVTSLAPNPENRKAFGFRFFDRLHLASAPRARAPSRTPLGCGRCLPWKSLKRGRC
jgi:hypothetical protein